MKRLQMVVVFLHESAFRLRKSAQGLRRSAPEGVLTKKNKRSIMLYEGFVIVARVWKRFQTGAKKRIGSTLNSFLNNRPFQGITRRSKMNTLFKKMNGRFATVLVVSLTALVLTACGGGGGGDTPPVVVTPPVASIPMQPSKAVVATGLCTPPSDAYTSVTNGLCLVTDTGPVRQAAKAAPRAAQALVPPITANELFDWAQVAFPTVFPAPSTTISASGFVYRYYASTNSYAAVADDGGVYVLFASGDNIVKYVAKIDAFSCVVKPLATGCAPVLSMSTVSPLSVTGQMTVVSNQPLKGIASLSIVSSNNDSFAGNASLSNDKLSITITPTSALPYSATLTVTVKATNEVNVEGTLTATMTTEVNAHNCPTPSVWTTGVNACVYPMGAKVLGTEFAQLPAGCTSVYLPYPSKEFSACWKDFVKTNKAKWVQTSRTMVGAEAAFKDRPITFSGFITPTGKYQVLIVFADTGDLMNPAGDIDVQVTHEGIDFMVGNDQGYLFRTKTTGVCAQLRWNPPTTTPGVSSNVWDFESVTCPQ